MSGWIYTYEDRDFKPDNIAMYGYVFSRSNPIEVDKETASKLSKHPHFLEVGNTKHIVAFANAADKLPDDKPEAIDKSGLLEASGIVDADEIKKAKKAAYMREWMAKKRAAK